MTRSRRIILYLLAGAGILSVLLAVLVLLGPRLLNTKTVRDYAATELERRTGVRFSYARVVTSFFPRPLVVVHEAAFEVPDLLQGKLPKLEAAPELLPLLRGKVRVGSLLLEGADLRVRIPAGPKPEKAFSAEELEGKLASFLAALERNSPATVVSMRNGRVELSDPDGPIVSLRGLNARVGFPPEQMTLSLRCASGYWDDLSIESSLHPKGLRGDTRVEAARFRIGDFVKRLSPEAAPWLGETELSLRGRIASEGLRTAKADFSGGVPALTIRRGARSRTVRVRSFEGSAEWTEKGLKANLSDLSVDDPRIRLSGGLTVDREAPAASARLEGPEADIPSIRSALLALAGDVPAVRIALDVVRGGALSRISLEARGSSPRDLAALGKLRGRATLRGGTIAVPGIGLTLENVGGEVSLSGGILGGEGLTARLKKSAAREGTLRMGFSGKDAPFHVEFLADADLGELQPLLRRLVPNEVFRGEIDRIREVRGSASGRVTLGERLSSIRPMVSISEMDFSGEYDRLPFPVAIRGGRAAYDGDGLEVTDLRGSIGGSTASGLTGRLGFGNPLTISIRGGSGRVALGELYPWIASHEGFRDAVQLVHSVRGVANFTALSCDGPLREPGKWSFDATGSVEDLEVAASPLPGPVAIPRGRFRMTPEELSFTDVEASLADAKGRGDALLRGYRDGVRQVAASFQGNVGVEAAKWAYARLGVPDPYAPKAPYTVIGSKLSWQKDGDTGAEAILAWQGGPDISLSLRKSSGTLSIDPLAIRDEASDAKVSFRLDPGTVKMKFAGTLSRSTVEKVLPIPVMPGHRIQGEMEAVLDRGKPTRSTARGTLKATGLAIPWKPLAPLAIREVSLSAEGAEVRVASSDLLWDNVPFSLTGTAVFGGETVVADLDLSAGDIDLERLEQSIKSEDSGRKETGAPSSAGSPGFPVRGALRFRADSMSGHKLTWRPVRGEAVIGKEGLRLAITEANLCGVSTLGTLTIDSAGPAVALAVSTSGENLDATITCVSGREVSVTGTYAMSARIAGKGTGDALVRSFRGPLELTVRDGRINQMTFLSWILT
ncbi:MAG: rane protein-like, partial [Deltaproteobacteria bacterium]|nr:rane protein-like [Deltaproteobacteria bacterium]